MARSPRGLFVGLATLDLLSLVPRLPHVDEKLAPLAQLLVAGGPATNAAIAFSELGGTACLATVLGRHHVTALAREELARHRVELIDLNHDPQLHLPLVTVMVQESTGERAAITAGSRTLTEVDAVPEKALDESDILLVDGHLLEASIGIAQAARRRGIPVLLDGGSWKPGLERLLPFVDHAICSEVFRAPGTQTSEEVVTTLHALGVAEVAITRGARPILCSGADGDQEIAVPPVDVVDTLGAGDIFHGAAAFSLAQGATMPAALAYSAGVAGLSCRFFGPRAWIDHLPEHRSP